MNKFNISQNGFIPESCLEESPMEFKYLDDILQKYQKGDYGNTLDTFRQEIQDKKLNVDECMILMDGYSDAEIQKLYSVTSILAHIYVWGGKIPHKNIPESISIPWYLSSSVLGISCVLTHAALDMYNWRLIDKDKPFSIENIEPQNYFNFDPEVRESEKWFYRPMIAIEGECGCIIHLMEEIYGFLENETADENQDIILKNLEFIEEKMKRQYEILQMTLKCNPDHFYYLIRPFLGGSKQRDTDGWYLEGIELYVEYTGGSAAQSSLMCCKIMVHKRVLESRDFNKVQEKCKKSLPDTGCTSSLARFCLSLSLSLSLSFSLSFLLSLSFPSLSLSLFLFPAIASLSHSPVRSRHTNAVLLSQIWPPKNLGDG